MNDGVFRKWVNRPAPCSPMSEPGWRCSLTLNSIWRRGRWATVSSGHTLISTIAEISLSIAAAHIYRHRTMYFGNAPCILPAVLPSGKISMTIISRSCSQPHRLCGGWKTPAIFCPSTKKMISYTCTARAKREQLCFNYRFLFRNCYAWICNNFVNNPPKTALRHSPKTLRVTTTSVGQQLLWFLRIQKRRWHCQPLLTALG